MSYRFLNNERFRSCIKLKEFITNEEKIKDIANMDHDDPIFHNKVFKFFKSTGKSILSYAWGTETRKVENNIELKEKGNKDLGSSAERSIEEIESLLSKIRTLISSQVTNLTELWSNIETLTKKIWLCNLNRYKPIEELKYLSFKLFSGNDWSLHELYKQICSSQNSNQNAVTELASHLKVNLLISSRKLLAKYKSTLCAVERLLELCSDVNDLNNALPKYKGDSERQEMYRSEYLYYLNVLRSNFDFLREDAGKMYLREEPKFKRIIEEFYLVQKTYINLIKSESNEIA